LNFTDIQVLALIRAHPDSNIYQLEKAARIEMPKWDWSNGKVHNAVQRLKRDKMVTTRLVINGGRSCQQVRSTI
jgi:hypothetical protein